MFCCRSILWAPIVILFFSTSVSYGQFVETAQSPGFLLTWGSSGSGNGQFNNPYELAVDRLGNLYVADTDNHRIQKFDALGNFVTAWGSLGSGNGQFNSPTGVDVDGSGNVYVADSKNHRIQKFDSAGNFVTKWGSSGTGDGELNRPRGLAVDASGNVYVSDGSNHRIQKFDSSGTFLTKWGNYGSADGQFDYPRGLASDDFGNVYVVDLYNYRIQKFDSFGVFLTKWGVFGANNGQFYYPEGVSVDASGHVYVADSNNDRIQKFDSAGNFISKWGSNGTGDGQFDFPKGAAVDAFGSVFVADSSNNRIQKFAPVREFRVQGEDVKLNVNRVSLTPANKIVMELKNNGSTFFKFTNTFNGQQWTLNPLGTSFTFDNLNNPGQEFRLYNTGRLVITPSSLGSASFDLAANGDLMIAGNLTAAGFVYPSDREAKEDFEPVDVSEVLNKVARMEISKWEYKKVSNARHMGPMAQDFYALFGLGADDKHLSPTDTAGVALAAIQGLHRELQEKDARIARLEAELAEIRSMLSNR